MVWWVVVMSLTAATEQWADEAPASEPLTVEPAQYPRVGPVIGAHLGASLSHWGPDVGGRIGLRVRPARHFALSLFFDGQHFEATSQNQPSNRSVTLWTGVLRAELVADGQWGPLFVPAITFGAFIGAGAELMPIDDPLQTTTSTYAGFRAGLHLGFTRLPNGWWFPFFLDVGGLCYPNYGCGWLYFVAGVGL